jgi:hypothetical protein
MVAYGTNSPFTTMMAMAGLLKQKWSSNPSLSIEIISS